jgi:hypothetical protein
MKAKLSLSPRSSLRLGVHIFAEIPSLDHYRFQKKERVFLSHNLIIFFSYVHCAFSGDCAGSLRCGLPC